MIKGCLSAIFALAIMVFLYFQMMYRPLLFVVTCLVIAVVSALLIKRSQKQAPIIFLLMLFEISALSGLYFLVMPWWPFLYYVMGMVIAGASTILFMRRIYQA